MGEEGGEGALLISAAAKKFSKYKAALIMAVFIVCGLAAANVTSLRFLKEIENLPDDKNVALSQLNTFQKFPSVCVLTPYAVAGGNASELDLKRIFGDVNYQPWKEEIINRYTGYSAPGFYLVKDKAIIQFISINGLYLKYAALNLEEATGFAPGCYRTDDVCVEKKKQIISVTMCRK